MSSPYCTTAVFSLNFTEEWKHMHDLYKLIKLSFLSWIILSCFMEILKSPHMGISYSIHQDSTVIGKMVVPLGWYP